MDSARTCWAEGMGMDAATVEALTLVAEESAARAGDARPELDPRDVSAWPLVLEEAGQDDLAERVRVVRGTAGVDDHIEAQAAESARLCLEQGWTGPGRGYTLGVLTGDLEALEERLGRGARGDERIALERKIRALLDEAA